MSNQGMSWALRKFRGEGEKSRRRWCLSCMAGPVVAQFTKAPGLPHRASSGRMRKRCQCFLCLMQAGEERQKDQQGRQHEELNNQASVDKEVKAPT